MKTDLNRRLLRAMLKTAPYHILEAKRPSEAMAILEREKVDLVIVDQAMPEMSGTEFCELVKNDRAHAVDSGADDHQRAGQ